MVMRLILLAGHIASGGSSGMSVLDRPGPMARIASSYPTSLVAKLGGAHQGGPKGLAAENVASSEEVGGLGNERALLWRRLRPATGSATPVSERFAEHIAFATKALVGHGLGSDAVQ